MKSKITIFVYFLVGILFLLSLRFLPTQQTLQLFLKASLMPLLIAFYLISVSKNFKYNILLIVALVFSLSGDIFLHLKGNEIYFTIGLASFLFSHITYIIIFIERKSKFFIKEKPIILIPFVMYWLGLLFIIFDNLHEMLIPVIVYSMVLLFVAIFAMNRYLAVNRKSFIYVFIGAILFVFSDSAIAISKFYQEFSFQDEFIMLTYISSQFLIVQGLLHSKKSKEFFTKKINIFLNRKSI